MSAGLPGLGLGGLFFIVSALLAPLPELWRTLRGRSGVAAWRLVGRQFAQAVAMIVAIDLTIRLVYLGLSTTGLEDAPRADTGTVLPLTLLGITSLLLVAVIGIAKLAELGLRIRTAELPRVPEALPLPAPLRAFAIGGIVTLAWFALLAVGASELSPLVEPREGRTAERRVSRARESRSSPVSRPVRQQATAPSPVPLSGSSAAPAVDADHEESRNDAADVQMGRPEGGSEARPALQPSVRASPPPTPAPPERPPAFAPPAVVVVPAPSAEPASTPPDRTQPRDTGPPATPGPPDGATGPGDPGPPPHARSR
jgi:hypothetical protein